MRQLLIKIIGTWFNIVSVFAPTYAANKALKLFSTPRKGRLTDEDIPKLQSAYMNELKYDGLEIRIYRWVGENKTILLVHGWESNAARWHELIKDLKKQKFNIITINAPAHGNSGGKEFNALLYSEFINVVAQKYQPEIIIGHSVGGMSSVFFQHKYQLKSLKKIVLLGSPANFSGVFERYVKMMNYNTTISKAMNAIVLERHGHLPEYYSVADFAKSIIQEGLIVHDKNDSIIPYGDALQIHKQFKNSKLVTTTNIGHGLKGPFVNETILNFINS